ncbi:MAG: hypothetical protein H6891_05800 [Brucellaceae bacterium]|nr:hypothetical protein [Brucellaceae bacterium]
MIRTVSNRFAASIALAVAATALPGCLSTPPSSIVRLARLSPLEADPAQIRIAVIHDRVLRVRQGDVTLRITYKPKGDGPAFDERYLPIVSADQTPPPELASQLGEDRALTVTRLSGEDAARMRLVQAAIGDFKAAGGDGSGTLAAGVEGCRAGVIPDGAVLVSTFLKTADGDTFFALSRNQDMRKLLAKRGIDIAAMTPCGADAEPR